MTENEKYAYCAGLFDGEGCIHVPRYRENRWGGVIIQVIQLRTGGLDFLISVFGGRRDRVTRQGRSNRYWRWAIRGTNAKNALTKMLPYMLEKRAQAALSIEYLDNMESVGVLGRHGLPEKVKVYRNRLADRISHLKRAGAETERERLG